MMQRMVIQRNDRQLQTLAQLQAFLDGTITVDFSVAAAERYGFIGRTVRRFIETCINTLHVRTAIQRDARTP